MNKAALFFGLLKGLRRSPRTLGFAEHFLAAWNAHDAGRVAELIGSGRYTDPLADGELGAEALRDHLNMLVKAFPDLSFHLNGPVTVGDGAVAARYTLSGTNTGRLPGAFGIEHVEPTGRRVSLPAIIFVEFAPEGIRVDNSFAIGDLAAQLGFYALLMPREQGDYQFGAYYRLNRGNVQPPEAIGMTWLQVRGADQFEAAARITNQVLESFADKPGFVTGIIGARPPDENGVSSGFTLSAWEDLAALEANLLPNAEHQEAVRQFMKEGLAWGTHSRVYQLVRAKPVMIACSECGKKNNAYKAVRVCSACGAELEPAPVHW